jgi:hypothetical protein
MGPLWPAGVISGAKKTAHQFKRDTYTSLRLRLTCHI